MVQDQEGVALRDGGDALAVPEALGLIVRLCLCVGRREAVRVAVSVALAEGV